MALRTILRRTVIVLLTVLVLAAATGLLFFKFVQHKIAARIQPPHLQLQPEPASDLLYQTLDGAPQHLSSNKGQVVFLDLWGTWCVQCVAEMPDGSKTLRPLQRRSPGQISDRFPAWILPQQFASTPAETTSTCRFTSHGTMTSLPTMQLNQYPATFLYAKDGHLVSKHVGAANWSDRSVISFIDHLKQQ